MVVSYGLALLRISEPYLPWAFPEHWELLISMFAVLELKRAPLDVM